MENQVTTEPLQRNTNLPYFDWDMDTQRNIKLLLRQRGSHLRKTVDADNVIVIRTPKRPFPSSPGKYLVKKPSTKIKVPRSPLVHERPVDTVSPAYNNENAADDHLQDLNQYADDQDPFEPVTNPRPKISSSKYNNRKHYHFEDRNFQNNEIELTRDSHYLPTFDNFNKGIDLTTDNLNQFQDELNNENDAFQYTETKPPSFKSVSYTHLDVYKRQTPLFVCYCNSSIKD